MLEGTQTIPSPNPLAVGLPSPASWRHPVLPLFLPHWPSLLGSIGCTLRSTRSAAGAATTASPAGWGPGGRWRDPEAAGGREKEKGRGREEKRGGRKAGPRSSLPAPPSSLPPEWGRQTQTRAHAHPRIHTLGLPPARTHCASGRPERRLPLWTPGRQSPGILPRQMRLCLSPFLPFSSSRTSPAAATSPASRGGAGWPGIAAQFPRRPRGTSVADPVLALPLFLSFGD